MTVLIIDEAWTKVDPAKAKADGYAGMIGYLSTDNSKNITKKIADAWHEKGLMVGFVWETTARRSAEGASAGVEDVARAETQAAQIGLPKSVAIYYATDFDATPAQVAPYYAAVASHSNYRTGIYGGRRVIDSFVGRIRYGWQATAWSVGISPKANIFQRLGHTRPPIGGSGAGYDEDILLTPDAGLWLPAGRPQPPTPPAPHSNVVERGVKAPTYPLPKGQYFGPAGGGNNSISGYHGHSDDLAKWQSRMAHRGWAITADGRFGSSGDLTPRGQTAGVALAAQHAWGLQVDSLIGPSTWAAAWSRDITRP